MTAVPLPRPSSVERPDGPLSGPLQPCVLLFACGVTTQLLVLPVPGLVRLVAALFLFTAAPGLAWAPVLRVDRGALVSMTCVVLISIAADVVVAQTLAALVGLAWGPCAAALVALTVVGAATRIGTLLLGGQRPPWARPRTAA